MPSPSVASNRSASVVTGRAKVMRSESSAGFGRVCIPPPPATGTVQSGSHASRNAPAP